VDTVTIRQIRPSAPEPLEIQAHAMDNLRYIWRTMERAESFTAAPGIGGAWMGVTALAAWAAGFGGLHLVFGLAIAVKYGG